MEKIDVDSKRPSKVSGFRVDRKWMPQASFTQSTLLETDPLGVGIALTVSPANHERLRDADTNEWHSAALTVEQLEHVDSALKARATTQHVFFLPQRE